jgi:hypothetical protein
MRKGSAFDKEMGGLREREIRRWRNTDPGIGRWGDRALPLEKPDQLEKNLLTFTHDSKIDIQILEEFFGGQ